MRHSLSEVHATVTVIVFQNNTHVFNYNSDNYKINELNFTICFSTGDVEGVEIVINSFTCDTISILLSPILSTLFFYSPVLTVFLFVPFVRLTV